MSTSPFTASPSNPLLITKTLVFKVTEPEDELYLTSTDDTISVNTEIKEFCAEDLNLNLISIDGIELKK
jgi:hypothetical protein